MLWRKLLRSTTEAFFQVPEFLYIAIYRLFHIVRPFSTDLELFYGHYYILKTSFRQRGERGIKFNSFPNCKNCTGNNTCSLCNYDYYFVSGNKTQCIEFYSLEEYKYCEDPNDTSNVVKCSEIEQYCDKCYFDGECFQCSQNKGLFYFERYFLAFVVVSFKN